MSTESAGNCPVCGSYLGRIEFDRQRFDCSCGIATYYRERNDGMGTRKTPIEWRGRIGGWKEGYAHACDGKGKVDVRTDREPDKERWVPVDRIRKPSEPDDDT